MAIGTRAGEGTLGQSKTGGVFIGYQAGQNEDNDNRLYIDNSNTSTPLIYGEFDTDIARINGTLQVSDPGGTGYQFPTTDGTANQVLANRWQWYYNFCNTYRYRQLVFDRKCRNP